jgi:methyltransferase
MTLAVLLLAFVTAERLIELWWARSNTRLLLAQGAVEHAPGHYPLIVALHAIWLLGLWLLGWSQPVSVVWFVVFIGLQVARLWVLVTLGRRWTTRILVLPGAPLVKKGPYRFLSHPNYLVVAGEIAVLPLCFGLFWYALAFSVLNAAVLSIRIRAESIALSDSSVERPT